MLEKVKLALGITTTIFDSDINDNIASARMEMIRAGVSEEKANSDSDVLIIKAIKTYCAKEYYEGNEAERYLRGWNSQLENLRKSSDYVSTK